MEKKLIVQFLAAEDIAVFGVSSSGKKFGAAVYKELKQKGRSVFAVNPKGGFFDGSPIFESLDRAPAKPKSAILVVPPNVAEKVVADAIKSGVKNIWLQPGAESDAAIAYCHENGINVIHGECILMHAESVRSIHKMHRFINKIFGKLPQ